MIKILATLLFTVTCTIYAQDEQLRQARELSWQGKHKEAIAEYDEILSKNPKNLDALEGKADVYSWMGDYDSSVCTYDRILEQKFIPRVARQKARVLAWSQNYRDSLRAYDYAYKNSKMEAIQSEMLGKKAWWDGQTLTAIEHYNAVLKLETDNLEVRSDIAQIEGQAQLVNEAKQNYEVIIKENPWHFRAQEGLDKVNIISDELSLAPSSTWFSSRSVDRFTEINRLYSELLFGVPFMTSNDLLLGYALDSFSYSNSSSILRHYGLIGLRSSLNARLWFTGMYGRTLYTNNDISSQRYNAQISFKPFEPMIISVFSQREDLFNNKFVLENRVHSTDAGVNLRVNINRHTVSILEYKRGFLNDSNRVNWASLEQLFLFLHAPTELTLTARFQFQDWKTIKNDYFSPQHFFSIPITLKWRHYLNKNGMYYGACDTYYGFRYQFQVDRGKIIFNGLGAEFHHDLTRKFALHYDVFGNYSNVYKDFSMYLGFVGYF